MKHYNGSVDFIDMYLDTSEESIEEVDKALEDLGISAEAVTNHFDNLIRREEAELKLERGRANQKRFDEMISSNPIWLIKERLKEKMRFNRDAKFAFNKLENIDDETKTELLDDELKLEILKGLGKAESTSSKE